MTKIALLHNHFEEDALKEVVEEMKKLGTPSIRVLDLGFDDICQALEGCHRLRACEVLGITPNLVFVDSDETVGSLGLDCDVDPDTRVDELGDWENYQIIIENGEIVID
jgi:hypothetical protein